jgi:hypothetical protein
VPAQGQLVAPHCSPQALCVCVSVHARYVHMCIMCVCQRTKQEYTRGSEVGGIQTYQEGRSSQRKPTTCSGTHTHTHTRSDRPTPACTDQTLRALHIRTHAEGEESARARERGDPSCVVQLLIQLRAGDAVGAVGRVCRLRAFRA